MRGEKYISSGGLAFAEARDMEKLRKFSLKGWHVSEFKFMGYKLEKGESADYAYCIDYRSLEEDEAEEYFEVLSSSGWSHVASEGNIHLFRARPGTSPIYTDSHTMVEKYKSSSAGVMKFVIPLAILMIFAWIGMQMSSGSLRTSLFIIAAILTAITAATAWTTITTVGNRWKTEGKRKASGIAKVGPFVLVLVGIIYLLLTRDVSNAARVLTSAIIGGIGLPLIICGIMSVFVKMRSARISK